MTPITNVRSVALQLLNGEPLTLHQWDGIAQRIAQILRTAEIRDPAVESAATIAGLLTNNAGPEDSALLEALPRPERRNLDRHEVTELHSTLLYATHATVPPGEPSRQLLAGLERELLCRPPTRLRAVMLQWRNEIATQAQTLNPADALAIATMQASLLRHAADLITRADIQAGSGPERLLDQVRASAHAWHQLRNHWRQHTDTSTPITPEISHAQFDLIRALSQAGETERLSALLATGLAGNLVAATAVTPTGSSFDLRHALALDSHAELLADQPIHVTAKPSRADTAKRPQPLNGIRMLPDSPTDVVRPDPPERPITKVARDDTQGHHQLRRVMDAGVIAEAALRGQPEAQHVTHGAAREELQQLVVDGEAARNGLVMSVLGVLEGMALRRRLLDRVEIEDLTQNLSLALFDAAERWDPDRATWFTWAHQQMEYAVAGANTRTYRRETRETPIGLPRGDGDNDDVSNTIFDLPVRASEEALEYRLRVQEAVAAIADLPTDEQEALIRVAYHQYLGSNEPQQQVAQETGTSTSTVSRRVIAARERLKGQGLGDDERTPTPEEMTRRRARAARVKRRNTDDRDQRLRWVQRGERRRAKGPTVH